MQEITLSMTDEEFEVFGSCFLRDMPIRNVQVLLDDAPQFDENGKPIMTDYTDIEWMRECVITQVMKTATKGWNKLTLDGNPMDMERVKQIKANL